MLIFHHFKAAFGALGVPIGQNKFQNPIQHTKIGYVRIFDKNFQICAPVKNGHKIG